MRRLRGRPVRAAAVALAAVVALSACGNGEEEADEQHALGDLSGLAWLGDGRVLAVHDAKNPDEADLPRVSVLRLPSSPGGVEARDVAVEWPEPLGESSDLESADRIPDTNRVLLAESGDDGSRFKRIFLAEVSGDDVEIVDSVEWPAAIENVEGMAVGRVGGGLTFLYAERAQGESSTRIAAATLSLDPLRFGQFRRARYASPAPTGPQARPVSALTVDSDSRIYAASAFDPDVDGGPFKSFVWRIGRLRATASGRPPVSLLDKPRLLGTLDGLKVESVAVREQDGRVTVFAGTDDENYGGALRPLPASP